MRKPRRTLAHSVRSRSTLRARSARSRSQSRWFRWSRSTPINAIAIVIDVDQRSSGPGEIAIVVRQCGWFRRSEGLTAQWRLDRAVIRVRGLCMWERFRKSIEVKIRTETNFSRFRLIFQSNWKCFQFDRILRHNQTRDFPEIDFRKSISVEPNGA